MGAGRVTKAAMGADASLVYRSEGKAIAAPCAHSAGENDYVIQTLPFEIAGLELRESAALGNEIERFGRQQFARAKKCFGRNFRRRK